MDAIDSHLVPLGVQLSQPHRDAAGGYFVWISLPRPLRGARVAQQARDKENLIVAQGEMFEVPGDPDGVRFPHDLRLCFSWETEESVVEGIRRLGAVLRELSRESESGGSEVQVQQQAGDDTGTGPDVAQFV